MRLTPTQKLQLFSILFSALMLGTTGCKSGQIAMPKFSDLAFWKKDELKLSSRHDSAPKPPSKLFDPEPSFDAVPKTAKEEIQASVDRMISSANNARDGKSKPIRTPYSTDQNSAKSTAKNDNTFKGLSIGKSSASGKPQDSLDGVRESLMNALQKSHEVQEERSKAASQKGSQTINKFSSNENDLTQGWREDIELPEPTINGGGGDFQAAEGAIKQAPKQVQKSADEFLANEANQLKNKWNQNVDAAAQKANAFGQQVAEAGQQAANDFAINTSPTEGTLSGTGSSGFGGMQVNPGWSTAPESSNQFVAQPKERVASSNNFYGVQSPADQQPGNVLRGSATNSQQGFSQPEGQTNGYQSTPHNSYAPPQGFSNALPKTNGDFGAESQQVGFQTQQNQNSNAGSASQIPTTRGIPDSIKHGSGSYSPGSINQLQPVTESWQPPNNDDNGFKLN